MKVPRTIASGSGVVFSVRLRRMRCGERGAAMVAVLMFIFVGSIALTAAIHLMGARLQQTERMGIGVKRHVVWGNTAAVNQQYAYTYSLRDNVTRTASTAVLPAGSGTAYADTTTWGGISAGAYANFSAYRSIQRASDATISYPFNNLRLLPTADNSVFYLRTAADSDSAQTESLTIYNYQKSYPSTLLGDLLIVHKRPTTSGTYSFSGNIRVDGRVVIYDGTAAMGNLKATSCLQAVSSITNTTKTNDGSASLMPDNFPSRPMATAGYGGTSNPTAVTNGTLKLIENTDFPVGSIKTTLESGGTSTWMTCSTNSSSSTNIETDVANGTSTGPFQVKLESSPTYPVPTTSPYGYTKSGNLNVLVVRLKNSGLKHLKIVSGLEQLVLEGQTTTTDYTSAAALDPVIIWVQQADLRDIRFIGENSRPLILAVGPGNSSGTTAAVTLYMEWRGSSLVSGGPLRWRMQLFNEYRNLYLAPPSSTVNAQIIGGIRTNWSINSTYTDSVARFLLARDASPTEELELMLPRDAWIEPYVLVR
ncbi:hypothetical protein DES53_114125 [Roseimicrobium gellanilyticum]|uniref:Uncharacterized protein n=1 Tax=Roseimicrobium gellanilyticum TaxID=748857 RepID=A0A366H5P6_9BACT|nr:hypothetical protein [Roseimicrobium gellanilyticum]RBP37387.1 hypothetical protein DES53_114125 [Roseimicrobium gellanilyticum]